MSSRSNKKSRKPKKVTRRFRPTLSEFGLPERTRIISSPDGQIKMSELLIEFIEPYEGLAQSEEDYRKLLSVGLVAWNAALYPLQDRRAMVDSIVEKAIPAVADDAKLIIDELIRRKDRHFSEIKRAMLSYVLTMTRGGPHVSVASTLEGIVPKRFQRCDSREPGAVAPGFLPTQGRGEQFTQLAARWYQAARNLFSRQ